MEKRFYELSREFHPDRFTTSGIEAQRLSLEKMSLLNEAYRTLKDPAERRGYLLKLEGIESKSKAPTELAEAWFEAQEDPAALEGFERTLNEFRAKTEASISAQEALLDQGHASREQWIQLADFVNTLNYLKSMDRDLERFKNANQR